VAVVEHVEWRKRSGVSESEACKELGLRQPTVRGWVRGDAPIRAVEVVTPELGGVATLVLPNGARVEGLSLSALIAVVKGLS
jgi:hypothetical protein